MTNLCRRLAYFDPKGLMKKGEEATILNLDPNLRL